MSEEMLVKHCSPTLAGIKTGNLFSCAYTTLDELREDIRRLNRKLSHKGLRILLMRHNKGKALIYVYRPSSLGNDMKDKTASRLLESKGYQCESTGRCVVRLVNHFKNSDEFPHEIGLFLGYPSEDVLGFIENNAKSFKFCGCWKVYGDEEKAKETFARFKKCTDDYTQKIATGISIEQLTVAV